MSLFHLRPLCFTYAFNFHFDIQNRQSNIFHSLALTYRIQEATLSDMVEIRKTDTFSKWIDGLRDIRARARVQVRIERLAQRNAGDVAPIGEGVSELRIDYGPGYRVYFKKIGKIVIILLAGGNKKTQSRDIKTALRLAKNL
jgi:putative addiction module killer protein